MIPRRPDFPTMPIYEYYCPDNHRIYSFYAKTLAQGESIPPCPDNPTFRMRKIPSGFAITGRGKKRAEPAPADAAAEQAPAESGADDARMEAALGQMEREFGAVDENDPRAMGRMMRRMSELSGEKLEGEMEEVVRKLEEGADPGELEEQLGEAFPEGEEGGAGMGGGFGRAPTRDPKLYDY